jgi:hypothetical protein
MTKLYTHMRNICLVDIIPFWTPSIVVLTQPMRLLPIIPNLKIRDKDIDMHSISSFTAKDNIHCKQPYCHP